MTRTQPWSVAVKTSPHFTVADALTDALPVHPDAASLDQLRGEATRFDDARIPQPLIEALLFR